MIGIFKTWCDKVQVKSIFSVMKNSHEFEIIKKGEFYSEINNKYYDNFDMVWWEEDTGCVFRDIENGLFILIKNYKNFNGDSIKSTDRYTDSELELAYGYNKKGGKRRKKNYS